jgi:hypothetical protein
VAVRLGVCFAIKCGGCKIEAEKFIRRGVRKRGRRNSQIRCESDCEKRHPGPIWVFLILFALFHAIFDFISPAARSNGQGKAAAPILYLLRARGWIDRLTLSLPASERASAENYFAAKKE